MSYRPAFIRVGVIDWPFNAQTCIRDGALKCTRPGPGMEIIDWVMRFANLSYTYSLSSDGLSGISYNGTWPSGLMHDLATGRIDLTYPDLYVTEERRLAMDFIPYDVIRERVSFVFHKSIFQTTLTYKWWESIGQMQLIGFGIIAFLNKSGFLKWMGSPWPLPMSCGIVVGYYKIYIRLSLMKQLVKGQTLPFTSINHVLNAAHDDQIRIGAVTMSANEEILRDMIAKKGIEEPLIPFKNLNHVVDSLLRNQDLLFIGSTMDCLYITHKSEDILCYHLPTSEYATFSASFAKVDDDVKEKITQAFRFVDELGIGIQVRTRYGLSQEDSVKEQSYESGGGVTLKFKPMIPTFFIQTMVTCALMSAMTIEYIFNAIFNRLLRNETFWL